MPGTQTDPTSVRDRFTGYSNAAVTANQYLNETVIESWYSLGGIKVYAETAGTGAGTTVVTLLKNGVSVWSTAGNRPTLASTSTGEFANTFPNVLSVQPGDRVAWQVAAISSTGHARLMASVSLEDPAGRTP